MSQAPLLCGEGRYVQDELVRGRRGYYTIRVMEDEQHTLGDVEV